MTKKETKEKFIVRCKRCGYEKVYGTRNKEGCTWHHHKWVYVRSVKP